MILSLDDSILISVLFFIVAIAYSSVGHAGASGYTAVLAIFNMSPISMRPISLILNISVGLLALIRFHKAGLIDYKKIFPFIVTSAPVTFYATKLTIDKRIFFVILSLILFASAIKFIFDNSKSKNNHQPLNKINIYAALFSGGFIGLLSGITGTGGAIFLSPILLTANWASPKQASGLSVIFVLANSIVGLAGSWKSISLIPSTLIFVWIGIVSIGALIGTHLGINKFSEMKLKKILGFMLLIASYKLLSTALHR